MYWIPIQGRGLPMGVEKARKPLSVHPQGPVTFDDPDLVIEAVLRGLGIGTALEAQLLSLTATTSSRPGSGGLVSGIPWILALLPESPEPVRSARRPYPITPTR